jgi:hypothetical protein
MKLRLALAGMFAASSVSCSLIEQRFDLLCNGTYTDMGSALTAFSSRLRINLSTGRFCIDDCKTMLHLTNTSPHYLQYRYDVSVADKDRPANRYRDTIESTAGPFDMKDEFSVNLDTGQFRRFYRYDFGDIAAVAHSERYTGRCTKAEFTPFPTQSR